MAVRCSGWKTYWQNALTEKNTMFLQTEDGEPVADDMFLNFWWTSEKLAPEELLKSSAELAQEKGIDPYSLYAGVDLQSNGYNTPIDWSLLRIRRAAPTRRWDFTVRAGRTFPRR